MLQEEIYSQKIENGNCSEINKSPLKWENPVVSSDEEIFESSSDSSIEDNDDSDTFGEASQETIIKSSLEEKDQIKDRTECIQPNYCIDKKSQQTSIKPPFEENEQINDINMCETQLNNCADSSAKSTESASLINEQYVSYLCNTNYNINNNNACLPDEISSQIDEEYFKISEVDNGASALSSHTDNTKNLKFNRNSSPFYTQCKDKKQNAFTNIQFIGDSNLKSKNCNLASSSNVHHPHFSSSEKLKTDDKLETCANYLIQPTEKRTAVSPPRYLIPIEGSDIHCDNKDDVTVSKLSDFTSYNCVNFVQYPTCTEKVESGSQCIAKPEESSIKTNGHRPKSFHFVKKINSSSESEEEYDFKYVIKNSSKNPKSSKIFNQKKNEPCNSNSIVNHNKHIQLKNNLSQVEKNLETIGTVSAYALNQKSSIVGASNKVCNSQQVKINNENNKTDDKCNDELENQSKGSNKYSLYNSLNYQSQFHNHKDSDNENMTSKILNNHKDQESIFKNTEEIHFDSEAMKTSTVVQNVSAVAKTYKNNTLNDNEIKNLDQELIDLSSDQSSGEIVTVNPIKDPECKILFNVKNFSSQKVSFTENRHGSKQQNSPVNSKLICTSNKENTSNAVVNSMYPKNTVKYNLTDDLGHNFRNRNSQQSSSAKNSGDSAEMLSENHFEQNSVCENKVLEKISSTWEIKTITPSSSGSSVIVEEVFSSSDLDDSPSLIAPNVPKTSNSTNFFPGSFCDLKRRKIEREKSSSSIKNKDCDKNCSKICDNFAVDSDSTPELLESNFSKNEYPFKQIVPEIIIDDDD